MIYNITKIFSQIYKNSLKKQGSFIHIMHLYLIYFNKQKYTDLNIAFVFLFLMQDS